MYANLYSPADAGNEAFYDSMVEKLRKEGATGAPVALDQDDIKTVVTKAREVFMSQPPLYDAAANDYTLAHRGVHARLISACDPVS